MRGSWQRKGQGSAATRRDPPKSLVFCPLLPANHLDSCQRQPWAANVGNPKDFGRTRSRDHSINNEGNLMFTISHNHRTGGSSCSSGADLHLNTPGLDLSQLNGAMVAPQESREDVSSPVGVDGSLGCLARPAQWIACPSGKSHRRASLHQALPLITEYPIGTALPVVRDPSICNYNKYFVTICEN